MPNTMIHEKVGYYVGKHLNINSYNYYLGLLAPDSPNLNGFAPKGERWLAHQRRKDYNEWRDSLKTFYNQEKDNYPRDFIIGYFVHILTDIIYDDCLYLNVRDRILNDNYTLEESHNIMRNDMDKYYFSEIEEIKNILNTSDTSYSILNISSEKLHAWKNLNCQTFIKENTAKYITEDIINILEVQVLKETYEELGN